MPGGGGGGQRECRREEEEEEEDVEVEVEFFFLWSISFQRLMKKQTKTKPHSLAAFFSFNCGSVKSYNATSAIASYGD